MAWRDHFDAQPDLERIWREDEKLKVKLQQLFPEHICEPEPTPRLNIGPLTERTLALCD